MNRPKDALIEGAQILKPVLSPHGFRFWSGSEGKGSGGKFASAEFVRKDRRLELHFRWSLGLVCYHVGEQSASHESYMGELGVSDRCLYPGFSDDPMAPFRSLAHDLSFADDFLTGSAAILQLAATKEEATTATQVQNQKALNAGDNRRLDLLRLRFKEKRYREVLQLAQELKYPNRMTQSQRRMVELARVRAERSAES